MFEIGRICVKIAGRDAGKKCVVVDVLDNGFVLIDGQTRRRTCNPKHLEPTPTIIKLKKGASHEEVKKEFSQLNIEVRDTKPKQPGPRPKKQKKKKTYEPQEEKKTEKKTGKKTTSDDEKEQQEPPSQEQQQPVKEETKKPAEKESKEQPA